LENNSFNTKKVALLGLMLSAILILVTLERMLPPLPLVPPNFKLGLSNIIVMYSLFFIGKREAIMLVILKSLFNLIMRNPVAGIIGFSGGIMSIFSIMIFYGLFKSKFSYMTISIIGAIFHNIGQLVAASFLLRHWVIGHFIPVLLVFGVIMGALTGTLLKAVMPALDRISK